VYRSQNLPHWVAAEIWDGAKRPATTFRFVIFGELSSMLRELCRNALELTRNASCLLRDFPAHDFLLHCGVTSQRYRDGLPLPGVRFLT
jgi:hypothetical protein